MELYLRVKFEVVDEIVLDYYSNIFKFIVGFVNNFG